MQYETIKLLRIALVILLASMRLSLNACDVCGCFIGVLPYDNQSSFMLMHRYRIFSGYPSMPGGAIFPAGAYRVSNPSVLHSSSSPVISNDDFESYKVIELRGKWFIHERVELNFFLPLSENRFKTNGIPEKTDGLGDASFLIGFHLLKKTGETQKFRHRLVAGIGVKLPTGKCNARNADDERYSVLVQNGTGSTDFIGYVSYTGGGYHFRWGGTCSGKLNGTNRYDENIGPSVTDMIFAGYLFSKGNLNFLPQLTAYHEYAAGEWSGKIYVPESQMQAFMTGPGFDIFYKHLSLSLSAQFPVQEKKYADELLNKGKFMLGISWNFNQQRYLLQKKN